MRFFLFIIEQISHTFTSLLLSFKDGIHIFNLDTTSKV